MKAIRSIREALFVCLLLVFIVPTQGAYASSVYDHIIDSAESLTIVSPINPTGCREDFSYSWETAFRNHLSGANLTSFDEKEAWAVSLVKADDNFGMLPVTLYIYWWESGDLPDTAVFSVDALEAHPTKWGHMSLDWTTCELRGGVFPDYSSIAIASAGNSSIRIHPFMLQGVDINYPVSYEGQSVSETSPSATYVALGDSFSSGEGNPPFEYGTDQGGTNENRCHRSSQAYPRLLQNDSSLNLGPTAFVACSGATTTNVLYGGSDEGSWDSPPQVDVLSDDTEVVTITIGGNDVGFKEFATECLFPVDTYIGYEGSCDEFTPIYDDTIDAIAYDLPNKLENVYGTLLNEAPNAKIYVAGYPQMAPYKNISDPFDSNCGGLYDAWPNNWGDARAAHEIVNLLNEAIEDAVDAANLTYSSTRLEFVSVDNGEFAGHDACSGSSYFNGINWPFNMEYTGHPNSDGHVAYKEDIKAAMN